MLERMACKIVDRNIKIGVLEESNRAIYIYGYQILLEYFIMFMCGLIVLFFTRAYTEVLFFCLIFFLLRNYSGGWHAIKMWVCTMISVLSIISDIIFVRHFRVETVCEIVLLILSSIFIAVLSPVDSESKRLDDLEKRKYKNRTKVLIFIFDIIWIACIKFNIGEKFTKTICYVYFIQLVNLIVAKLKDCRLQNST